MTENAPLGTTTKNPSNQQRRALYADAYNLLDHAQELLQTKNHRTCICCNYRVPDALGVDINRNLDEGTAGYGGLMKCGNVWACPVCARKISEQRRIELQSVVDAAKARGDRVLMLNLTHQHKVGDSLKGNKDQMTTAYSRLVSGRWWMEMKDWLGLVGTVRALEITYTYDNGWHVHFHVLLIIKNQDHEPGEIESHFAGRWSQVLHNMGGFASRDRGCVVTENESDIASYINKQGELVTKAVEKQSQWTESHELAKQVTKKSKTETGRTPFQLLADSANGDRQASALFLEYVAAMKHARQLVYSNGLKQELLREDELTDEQIMEMPDGETIATVDIKTFRAISRVGARGWVLDAAASGRDNELHTFLNYMRDETWRRKKTRQLIRHGVERTMKQELLFATDTTRHTSTLRRKDRKEATALRLSQSARMEGKSLSEVEFSSNSKRVILTSFHLEACADLTEQSLRNAWLASRLFNDVRGIKECGKPLWGFEGHI